VRALESYQTALNSVVVLREKQFDLFVLARGGFQILCQMIEILVDLGP
jgi:hypothetical protein